MSVKEAIIFEHFNLKNPETEMIVNVNNYSEHGTASEVEMIINYMEDEGFVRLSRKSADVYGLIPTERGIQQFKNMTSWAKR